MLIHLLDGVGKYSETRYVFWMYVALMASSLATAGLAAYAVLPALPRGGSVVAVAVPAAPTAG